MENNNHKFNEHILSLDDVFAENPSEFLGMHPDINPEKIVYKGVHYANHSCKDISVTGCSGREAFLNGDYESLERKAREEFVVYVKKIFPRTINVVDFVITPTITSSYYPKQIMSNPMFDSNHERNKNAGLFDPMIRYDFFFSMTGTAIVQYINGEKNLKAEQKTSAISIDEKHI